ncbi:hypothetical protein ACFYY8_23890 [Streptosporangium sp. NPDC001559]|uniref:hypothetical protein n=1 Tax=Streptosporangium sp. NPDC001559 TaxID=3366187 RepID=UPI0036EF249D
MSSGFEISRGTLEQESSRMRTHGEDYAAAVRRLRERGLGGSSWGDNGLLSTFLHSYSEAGMVGLDALTGLSQVIDGTGGAMSTVVANTDVAEQASIPYGQAGPAWG